MGRLPTSFTEEDVAGLVKKFGAIRDLFIIREKGSKKSKGIVFPLSLCISSVCDTGNDPIHT